MTYYARKTGSLCTYFNGLRLTGETIVSGLPPSEISFKRAAELRIAKFRMMEQGLIGDNFSAIALGCGTCHACIPLRVNVKQFKPTKALQAVTRRNRDLIETFDFTESAIFKEKYGPELYSLFKRYIDKRHDHSKMSGYEYDDFLVFALPQNRILTLTTPTGKIVAAALMDMETDPSVHKSLHYYYAFYDPDSGFNPRSLGTALWLKGIEYAQKYGFEYIYVGAGAAGSPKLAYKFAYPGLEAFHNGKWETYDAGKHTAGPDHTEWLRKNTLEL